jgi:membrane-associated phospholipid phosphatase
MSKYRLAVVTERPARAAALAGFLAKADLCDQSVGWYLRRVAVNGAVADRVARTFSNLGNPRPSRYVPWSAAALALWRHDGAGALACIAAPFYASKLAWRLKLSARRRRPCFDGQDPAARDLGSMPSCHAASAFASYLTVAHVLNDDFADSSRRLVTVSACACAASISLSRVFLGEHYLSDALVGGCIGASTFMTVAALRRPARLWRGRQCVQSVIGPS